MEEELLHYDSNIIEIYEIDSNGNQRREITKLNREKLKLALQITGLKISFSINLSEEIFKKVFEDQHEMNNDLQLKQIQIDRFSDILSTLVAEKGCIKNVPKKKEGYAQSFFLACQILEKKSPFIMLIGGTSGSGKSTLGSIIAARFGIPTALSTDSIRQIMRNFVKKEDHPLLFASTYEAGKYLPEQGPEISDSVRIIKGYKKQCSMVQEKLITIIREFVEKREPLVIEGVHLTPKFMFDCMKEFKNVISFFLYINNEKKHRSRFAVRSKYMILEKNHNKYVKNFHSIRLIQKWFQEKADQLLIPKVNNLNVDKTLGIMHKTTMRYYMLLHRQNLNFDELHNFLPLYEIFNNVTKNSMSTQQIKSYVSKKVNKGSDYISRMIDELNENQVKEEEILQGDNQTPKSGEHQNQTFPNQQNPTSDAQKSQELSPKQDDFQDYLPQVRKQFSHPNHQSQGNAFENEQSQENQKNGLQEVSSPSVDEEQKKRQEILEREKNLREYQIQTKTKSQNEQIRTQIMEIDDNKYQEIEDLNNDKGSPLQDKDERRRKKWNRSVSVENVRIISRESQNKTTVAIIDEDLREIISESKTQIQENFSDNLQQQQAQQLHLSQSSQQDNVPTNQTSKEAQQVENTQNNEPRTTSSSIREKSVSELTQNHDLLDNLSQNTEKNQKLLFQTKNNLKVFLLELIEKFKKSKKITLVNFDKQNIKGLRRFMFKHGFKIRIKRKQDGKVTITHSQEDDESDSQLNLKQSPNFDNISNSKESFMVNPQISENNSNWGSTQYRIYEQEESEHIDSNDEPFDYLQEEENVNSVDEGDSLNSDVLDDQEDEDEPKDDPTPKNLH